MATISKILVFSLLVLILYSVGVSAQSSNISVANINNIDLGEIALGTTAKSSFTLTNNGNVTLNDVKFSFSNSAFTSSFNKSNFNLSNGTSENINFTLAIPAVTSTGNVTLGSVSLASPELSKTLFSVKAVVVGGLDVEDLDVFLSTRPERRSDGTVRSGSASDLDVTDGRRLDFDEEDVGPGSELRFNINIENNFKENDNIDIEDVVVTVTIDGIDDGDDIEEESSEFDVDSGKSEEVDVFIDIPLSVDEGSYDILIEVEGDDTNGNTHTAEFNLEMDVKKKSRNVIVAQASLFPQKIICSGTSTLTATIKNIGTRTEENAGIGLSNSNLGISYLENQIELEETPFDEDDEFTKNLPIVIERGKSGTHTITVSSYIEENVVWETKTVNLEVEACSDQAVEEEPAEEEVVEEVDTGVVEEVEEETTEGIAVPVLQPEVTTEVPLTQRSGFWVAVVLLNIIVIGAIAYVVASAMGKKT